MVPHFVIPHAGSSRIPLRNASRCGIVRAALWRLKNMMMLGREKRSWLAAVGVGGSRARQVSGCTDAAAAAFGGGLQQAGPVQKRPAERSFLTLKKSPVLDQKSEAPVPSMNRMDSTLRPPPCSRSGRRRVERGALSGTSCVLVPHRHFFSEEITGGQWALPGARTSRISGRKHVSPVFCAYSSARSLELTSFLQHTKLS